MTKLLGGANWSTTVSGGIFTLAIAIAADPKLIAFLPDTWEGNVQGVCGLIAVLAGGAFAYQTKSKHVTGGTVQQTAEGGVASPAGQEASASVADTKQALPKP